MRTNAMAVLALSSLMLFACSDDSSSSGGGSGGTPTGPGTPTIEVRQFSTTGHELLDGAAAEGSRDFGAWGVDGGATAWRVFHVLNAGTADVEFSSLALGGDDPGEFELDATAFSAAVTPGGSHSFSVAFNPTTAGDANATVSFEYNLEDEAPLTFTLNFTGHGLASGTVIFVSPTGDNANNGLTPANAKGTIANAVTTANSDTDIEQVAILAGTYDERNIAPTRGYHIRGEHNGGSARSDSGEPGDLASLTVLESSARGVAFTISNVDPVGLVIEGLHFIGYNHGLNANNSGAVDHHPTDLQVSSCVFEVETNDGTATGQGGFAVRLFAEEPNAAGAEVRIANNLIWGNDRALWAIAFFRNDGTHSPGGGAHGLIVEDNYIEKASGANIGNPEAGPRGVYLRSSTGAIIRNNTIKECRVGIAMAGALTTTIEGNLFDGNLQVGISAFANVGGGFPPPTAPTQGVVIDGNTFANQASNTATLVLLNVLTTGAVYRNNTITNHLLGFFIINNSTANVDATDNNEWGTTDNFAIADRIGDGVDGEVRISESPAIFIGRAGTVQWVTGTIYLTQESFDSAANTTFPSLRRAVQAAEAVSATTIIVQGGATVYDNGSQNLPDPGYPMMVNTDGTAATVNLQSGAGGVPANITLDPNITVQ